MLWTCLHSLTVNIMEIKVLRNTGLCEYTLSSKKPLLPLHIVFILAGISTLVYFRPPLQTSLLVLCAILAAPRLLLRERVTESIKVIYGVGVQLDKCGPLKLLGPKTRFIPKNAIRETLINEIFEGHHVVYVIQIILKDSNKILLGFETMRTQIDFISKVWNDIQDI